MATEHVPFLILGGGAAAFAAATRAEELGVETVILNAGLPVGGTCVNVGCIPSKFLLATAARAWRARHPEVPGLTPAPGRPDTAAIQRRRAELVTALRRRNYLDVLASFRHVRYVEGHARFVDPHTVAAAGHRWHAERILVAVGARPVRPPIPGVELPGVVTSRDLWELPELPGRLVVVGAGPLGLELAQACHRLGSTVTILEAAPQVAPALDPDVAAVLRTALEAEGLTIHTGVEVMAIETGAPLRVRWRPGPGTAERTTDADVVLLATGMRGNADGIVPEAAGLQVDERGFVVADTSLRTNLPHVWAAGDVLGRHMLEHAAGRGGRIAADNALTEAELTLEPDAVPAAIFTDPEVAWVGLTERAYMDRYGTCRCRSLDFSGLARAVVADERHGMVRLTVDHRDDRLVGAQMVGPHAADAIAELTLAIRQGLALDELIATIHVFPTYGELFKSVALAFRRDMRVAACCIA